MAGPVSSRPISGAGISHDAEDPDAQEGVFRRKYRVPVTRDRYPGLSAATKETGAAAPIKSQAYQSLSPESQAKVARLVVGLRIAQARGET